MSVIKYITEEDIDNEFNEHHEKEKVETPFNSTMVTPKMRIAVCGPAKSGKTFTLNEIEEKYLQCYDNPIICYLHLNKLLNFDCSNDVSATQIRDYVSANNTFQNMSTSLEKKLDEMNDNDLILIDDVRHDWEFNLLRQYGFYIIYVDTKYETRLKRAKCLNEVHFMCSQREIELREAVGNEVFMNSIDLLYEQKENCDFDIWTQLMKFYT